MKKLVLALIALGAIVAVASPAFAEIKLNGYYRLQGQAQSFTAVEDTETMFDNRLRLKMTDTLNDYISVVYYGEVDTPWGMTSKGGVGGGGQVAADGVNVETKNAYVNFKLPDTSWSVTTGVQGWGASGFEYLVIADDMAGLNAAGDLGPVKVDFMYSKFNEGVKTTWDDVDFYGLNLGMKAGDTVGLKAFLGYKDDNAAQNTDMFVGLNGDVKIADIGLEAFVLYKSLVADDGTGAVDEEGSAWVADLKGKMKMPFGNMKAHFAYFSADDDATDKNTFDPAYGAYEYASDNLMIFLTDVYYNNGGQGGLAIKDAAYEGYGLMLLTVSGDVKMGNDMYAKYGAGYFAAVDNTTNNEVATTKSKDLGFEVDAMIGKKFAEKYDLSLRGAYAVAGDFYKVGTDSPDDMFKVVAMLNVGF